MTAPLGSEMSATRTMTASVGSAAGIEVRLGVR